MFEIWQLQLGLIALLAVVVLILFKRYPSLNKYIPFITWVVRQVRVSLDYWGARKVYKNSADVVYKYTGLLEVYAFSQSPDVSKKWFSKFILDTYDNIVGKSGDKEEATRMANAFYTLLHNHNDIIETLRALDNLKDLDVKRTTLIFIDFLGEFFTLSNRIDRYFYESMIVGINKVLLELKKGGLDKKTTTKISATLWRMFQLARAYKQSKDRKGISKSEFEKRMQAALSTLLSYVK